MTAPKWFYALLAIAALVTAGAAVCAAAVTWRGRWVVVDYESRGPSQYAKVLINERTGVVCELNRDAAAPGDPALGQRPFWMCSRGPKAGEPFLP
jgi:hypothetical protein